ncbi:MAG: phosphoglucomutase/phosphomannomutase family protein [Bacteroidetes bacterium]|nr:MAG: phosphoglucomutase/phosphomannomutase family protein [Bacteroidota bacterium]MBL1145097.1 phosphoglucomutase/phosphomannomutase family protein [Bacteroidota bacterium]MCB0802134.1 phosphoglucomutase/phosphomannomutase family protein [Flavobacteriales bacterium]NOG57894.1 phosphoglucomutase/phosphomannomutase family protein [Bacteroidota bacterium]
MSKIKFGTDGWRAIIAKDYTVDNVARVSSGTAIWLKANFENPSVVIGHDCRFAGELFAETAAKVLADSGVKVFIAKGPVSTPMVSLGALRQKASLGVVITASHNPPSYNGFKLKGHFGGPLLPQEVQEVEDLIPDENTFDLETINFEELVSKGKVEYVDLETMYFDHVEANFDMEAIRNSKMNFAFDAMYGAGQDVMRRLMPDIAFMHAEHNPGFDGQAPEPIHRNLMEFSEMIQLSNGEINCGLAVDGDADRIGLYNSKGEFIDSHHIILLLIKYLVEEKKMTGKVVAAFSVSPKIKKLCDILGLDIKTVQIGFKHIAGYMVNEDVLLGGEESGGIAIKGHIPERDGIWMGLTIWEYMVKSGKSLEDLIDEVYKMVGSFKFERIDLHLKEVDKLRIMQNCADGKYTSFGSYKVQKVETIDGYKYYFDNEEWVMIRPSGTEPVLRTYAESATTAGAFKILKEVHEAFQN